MSTFATSSPVHEHLDTSYVSLPALLRYLQQREFVGRIHVELDEYSADVFLQGTSAPRVHEIDHTNEHETRGEDLRRLLVRASAPGGLVSVYEGADEAIMNEATGATATSATKIEDASNLSPEEMEWSELLRTSGELIAAAERAGVSAGADFKTILRAVRLELADDYPFLDPSARRFEYADGAVQAETPAGVDQFAASIIELLRRAVDKFATGPRARSVRERVALELAVLVRRRHSAMERFKFKPQLDRIAGTRVL